MGLQSAVLRWEVIILLLIHFFIDDILFGNPETSAGSLLVNLGRTSRRFNAGFQAAITAARGSDVGPAFSLNGQFLLVAASTNVPLLVLFVSSFCLNRSARADGSSQWRH